MQSIKNLFQLIWLIFWTSFMSVVLFIPMTVAAVCSVTGNLAFNISKLWAWTMLIVTGVKVRITGREKINKRNYIMVFDLKRNYSLYSNATTIFGTDSNPSAFFQKVEG